MDPRPAATLVVVRPGEDAGVEVLMLRRSAESPFAPGFFVFPGGVVEEADEALAERLFGDPGEATRAGALRELYEETALLLGAGGLERVEERPPLASRAFAPPPPAALVEIARWIAPEFLAVRFDAVFYGVGAPRGLDPVADGIEADRAWWARPRDVLGASVEGEAPLMWPTLVTLEQLVPARSVEEVLAMRIRQIEPGREDRPAPVRGAWLRPEGGRP